MFLWKKHEDKFFSNSISKWINDSPVFHIRYHGCVWHNVQKDSDFDFGCEDVGELFN